MIQSLQNNFSTFKAFWCIAIIAFFSNNIALAQANIKSANLGNIAYCSGGIADYGPWLDIKVNGVHHPEYVVTYGSWNEYSDGTGTIVGRLTCRDNTSIAFDFEATMSSKTTSATPHFNSGGCVTAASPDWYFYTNVSVDFTGIAGTATEGAALHGAVDPMMPIQVGTGGTLSNASQYGASTWMSMNVVTQPVNGTTVLSFGNNRNNTNDAWANGDDILGTDLYFGLTDICENITDAGAIGYDASGCASAGGTWDPPVISSLNPPTGGVGTMEIVWIFSTIDPAIGANWAAISGANGLTYDPGPITQTTWFRRCSRRAPCSSFVGESNDIQMTVLPKPTVTLGNASVCAMNSTNITASGGNTYVWNTGATTAAIWVMPSATTTFTVTATAANGCTKSATSLVTVLPTPTPTISGITSVFLGQSTTLNVTGVSGSNTYNWSNGASTASITVNPTTTTIYTVTVTNSANCTATATAQVVVNTVSVTNANICNGASAMITAYGGDAYRWNTGENVAMIWVMPMTTTIYTVTITKGGASTSLTTTVTVNPKPTVVITGDGVICGAGTTTTITATGGISYAWSNGTTTAANTVATAGYYTVTVTNSFGCTATSSLEVYYSPIPTVTVTGANTICAGASATLTTTTTNTTFTQWSNGATTANITVSPTATTTYTVTVTGPKGCPVTTSVTVVVQGCASLGDFVWYDGTNASSNNVQDTGESGIANVSVTLYNNIGRVVATTFTNASGKYLFTNLLPGQYSVGFVTPAGMTPVTQILNTTTGSDANILTGRTPLIGLAAGENRTDIDAGFKAKETGKASIGNRVWLDVNQNGIQDANETYGISGVNITLYRTDGVTVVATTTTDGNGFYTFTNLVPTGYILGFSTPSGYTVTHKDIGDDKLDSDADPITGRTGIYVLLTNENNMTIDMGVYPTVIPPSTGSIGDFVWEDVNQDGLQTTGERGITGVTVTLYAANSTTVIATTTTDINGYYLFAFVPAGDYYVTFSNIPNGYTFTLQTNNTANGSDVNGSGDTPNFTLAAGQNRTDIDAGLLPGSIFNGRFGAIGDRVWEDVNGNGIFEPATEAGVNGIVVSLLSNTGVVLAVTVTDEKGYYIFDHLVAGTYSVLFGALPTGQAYTLQNTSGSTNANDSDAGVNGQTQPINLASSEVNLTIDAGIVTEAIIGDFVWLDTNNNGVQNVGEAGVENITVNLYDENNLIIPIKTTTTNVDGIYYFHVIPGNYVVGFETGTYKLVAQTVGTDNGSDADITTGLTPVFSIVAAQQNFNIDAGVRINSLPVQLVYFVAAVNYCEVNLHWQTATELNNQHFIIQRAKDAINFETIGIITGAGTINTPQNYTFTDKKAGRENTYRLLQVDYDGITTSYVANNVVKTNGCFDGTENGVTEVYPNPNSGNTAWFKFYTEQGAEEVNIILSDAIGRVINIQTIKVENGANVVPVNIEELPNGHYYIQVKGNGWFSPIQKLVRMEK